MTETLFVMKREEVIDNLESWIELREVRNELEHDYPDGLMQALRDVKYCIDHYSTMETYYHASRKFANRFFTGEELLRLPERVKNSILHSIQDSFGSQNVYLFGSRTDDSLQGGDIDIAVEISMAPVLFRKKRAKFFTNLLREGYNPKIDLGQYNPDIDTLFRKEIDSNKIKLE